jgi:plastocyanin
MRRRTPFLALLLALVLAVAACGGDDEGAEPANGGGGGQTLELAADPGGGLSYDKSSLEASAGEATIVLTNESSVEHDVRIEELDVGTDIISEGTDSVTLTLEPGTYTFFCSVPGHREGGMEGTLTVE